MKWIGYDHQWKVEKYLTPVTKAIEDGPYKLEWTNLKGYIARESKSKKGKWGLLANWKVVQKCLNLGKCKLQDSKTWWTIQEARLPRRLGCNTVWFCWERRASSSGVVGDNEEVVEDWDVEEKEASGASL